MVPDEAGVLLELEIPPELVTPVNIAEWGMILNYAYIPAGEEDGQAHRKKLNALGLSDAKVCMSHFYPELKQEITDSWQRLFDPSVSAGNDSSYGTVWELRKEWHCGCIRRRLLSLRRHWSGRAFAIAGRI